MLLLLHQYSCNQRSIWFILQLIYRLAQICHKSKQKVRKTWNEAQEHGETFELRDNGAVINQDELDTESENRSLENVRNGDIATISTDDGAPGRERNGVSTTAVPNSTEDCDSADSSIIDPTEDSLHGLFHHLKIRQDKMRSEFQETAKWFKVATKMDKIFFWGYGISVTILTFYAFVFKPMQKDVEL